MKIFDLHKSIISDYSGYIKSFINIKDDKIKAVVDKDLDEGRLWPDPLIQFNPTFEKGKSIDGLIAEGKVDSGLSKVFKGYKLFKHQVEAIEKGVAGESFIVTSGTGSGKSLTFLSTIFNYLLRYKEDKKGIKAILVYPMNALINSQGDEIKKYAENYGEGFPITFAKYTSQEGTEERQRIREEEPDIILTNYMMLELIMTRASESSIRKSIFENLKYLVFDELHTYRGRQGSDVSLLIRRIHASSNNDLICIGTSATMASADTIAEEKEAVAQVGIQIFNKSFNNDQIVGEYLENCTKGGKPEKKELIESLESDILLNDPPEKFISHPIARWLEETIALKYLDDNFKKRGEPKTLKEIVNEFAEFTGLGSDYLQSKMVEFLNWTEQLNEDASKLKGKKSYLPFKFHQFIAQTGNVYVTLENIDKRQITTDVARYLKEDNKDIDLYPVLFSRVSGYEFICVTKDFETGKLLPRDPRELPEKITKSELKANKETGAPKKILSELDFPDGYIIIPHGEEELWNDQMIENFPDSWKKITKKQTTWNNFYENRIPSQIYVNKEGFFSQTDNGGVRAWFIPTHILYDLTSGIIYDQRTNEFTKLMKLGNEGRSTATTVTTLSTLNALRNQNIALKYQKLLSFTDNRQDASLQAGHFNDFVSTLQLRSAIYHALKENKSLDSKDIAIQAVKKLGLNESEFAVNPSTNPKYPDKRNVEALEDYVFIRILYDLKRGWKYNTPNLEQAALLKVDYLTLDQLAEDHEEWAESELFSKMSVSDRKDVIRQILDFFRTSYALDHFKLTRDNRSLVENRIKERLIIGSNWCLNIDEQIDVPFVMIPKGIGKTPREVYTAGCGHQSYLGKYVKRLYKNYGIDPIPKGDALTDLIIEVLNIMEGANMLSKSNVKGSSDEVIAYQLRLDQVIWKLGDEKSVMPDKVRVNAIRDFNVKPNSYFQEYYKIDFSNLEQEIKGGEHTGQLSSAEREERETEFKSGVMSAMFCSPTMELGVDISSMNVVHMRNVPPGPANYAQRSGRAGRSGQTALVMTYCSNGSPHDRHYFDKPIEMVSGVVVAPKLDLTNQELIASHLNAYILMELALEGVHTSVSEVLDLNDTLILPIRENIKNQINNNISLLSKEWKKGFLNAISGIIDELKETNWFTENWLDKRFNEFTQTFDAAFDRWRILYKDANKLIERARRVIDDPTFGATSPERRNALWDQRLGQMQKDILMNDTSSNRFGQSEFYVFRYLASEGFLPGYNFTRLPIRTFLGDRDKGEYLSRPRFIALKEFGPNNLIYHSGSKYRVNRMMITDSENKMHALKICNGTGYVFLDVEGETVNNDPITGAALKNRDAVEIKTNVLELAECHTKPVERISCEEEERTSTGYNIEHYFSFPKGIHSTTKTVLKYDGEDLLNIIYGPSTRLLQLNRKWRRAKKGDENGYRIGANTGFWKTSKDAANPNPGDPIHTVHIFTTNTTDALYIEPVEALKADEDIVITINYAIKRAIEMIFQIEENELGAWIMGTGDCPNILLYEASEGTLGVLSELAKSPEKLKMVFEKAYEICHFDVKTKQETEKGKATPKASYDDLLSYFNQRHHEQIDRHKIRKPLELLMGAKIEVQTKDHVGYQVRYEQLLSAYDKSSVAERKFLNYLYNHGIRLPDRAQVNLEDYYINADFIYIDERSNEPIVVFIDGSVHDDEGVIRKDERQRSALKNAGYDMIVWRYDQPLEELVEKRKDIFRKEVIE